MERLGVSEREDILVSRRLSLSSRNQVGKDGHEVNLLWADLIYYGSYAGFVSFEAISRTGMNFPTKD